jgi:hypothetical protein
MGREQNVSTANFRDETANPGCGLTENPFGSIGWPDGGVVTQRTANPLSPGANPHKFARFTLRSLRGVSRAYRPHCELAHPHEVRS